MYCKVWLQYRMDFVWQPVSLMYGIILAVGQDKRMAGMVPGDSQGGSYVC